MHLTRHSRVRIIVCLISACAIAAALAPSANAAFGLKGKWGTNNGVGGLGLAEGEMIQPLSVAQGPGGEIFVTEGKDCSVRVYSAAGAALRSWGGVCDYAASHGLAAPNGIAVDMNGNVYVADTTASRVQVYDSSGIWLRTVGSYGTKGGQFASVYDVTLTPLSATPDLYVSDSSNYRIQKFNSAGAFQWARGADVDSNGGTGVESCTVADDCKSGLSVSTPGAFGYPVGIDLAAAGGPLMVGEPSNNRVQQLSPTDGSPISSFPTPNPWGLAVAPNGDAWVSQGGQTTATVRRYDAAGALQITLGGSPSPAPDGLGAPFGLSATASGGVLIADNEMHRISEFGPTGTAIQRIGKNGGPGWARGTAVGSFSFPRDVSVSGSKVWVADSDNNRIQSFGLDGTSAASFGSAGGTGGKFIFPTAVAGDANGLWIADGVNQRIQKLSADGTTFLAAIGKNVSVSDGTNADEVCTVVLDCQAGTAGNGPRQFGFPTDIAIAPNGNINSGNIYVVEQNNNRIEVFNPTTYALVATVGADVGDNDHTDDGEVQQPQAIAFEPDGSFWVAESYRMQKFNANGTFNKQFATLSGGFGVLPYGVAVVGTELHVSEEQASRIAVYDISSGATSPIRTYGAIGSNDSEFFQNYQLAAGPGGDVYVADSGNGRIQRFGDVTAPPAPTVEITSPADGTILYNETTVEVVYTATNSVGQNLTCTPLTHSPFALNVGNNAITVTCTNPLGGTVQDTVNVTRVDDTEDPVIVIDTPVNGQILTSPSAVLDYGVSDDSDPSPDCAPASGTIITPTLGANTIVVTCTDLAGNVGTASVGFTYAPADPVSPPSGPPPAGPSAGPPVVTLTLAKSLKFKGTIPVNFTCDIACTYKLSVSIKFGKKTATASSVGGIAGGAVAARVKFKSKDTKKIKAALKSGKKLKAAISLTAESSSGAKTGKSGSVKMSK